MPHEHIPVHANRRAVPTLFHIFPRARVMLLPLPCRPANDTAHGRRNNACRRAHPRRPSAGFCRAAETMLADGLVQGGFLRDFAGPPRRCFPMGSSEAAFHGIFQRRRCAQRRRSLLSFFPPPPGRTSFFTIRPDNDAARAHSRSRKPAGSPFPFPHFPARPSHASSFTLPPAIGCRVRTPRRCFPMGSSEAAFHGVFQCRRGGASRGARPRRLSTGFSNGGAARSAAVPFCPSFPRRPVVLLSLPSRPANDTAHGRRGDARRRARPRWLSAGFCRAAAAVLPDGLV